MRKYLAKVIVSGVILTLVAVSIDTTLMVETLASTNLLFFALSALAALTWPVINGAQFSLITSRCGMPIPLWQMVRINFISRFYSLLLPSGLGQGLIRWYQVTNGTNHRARFFAITIVHTMLFVLLLLAGAAIPQLFIEHENTRQLAGKLMWIIIPLALICTLGCTAFLSPALQKRFSRLAGQIGWPRPGGRIHVFLSGCALAPEGGPIIPKLLAQGIAAQGTLALRAWLLFMALGFPLSPWDAYWICATVMLLQILPFTLGGLGLREVGYGYLFTLYGLAPEAGVAAGMLFFGQMLVIALVGFLLSLKNKN